MGGQRMDFEYGVFGCMEYSTVHGIDISREVRV